MMLSTVQIFAAGTTGAESIDLQIDNSSVTSFTGLGDGASQGNFISFEYSTDEDLTADQVRIAFANDLYEPENGIDRNVRIDRIVIDDVAFESEDPAVFSTGTWISGAGIASGFNESEYLHANGYFQYADNETPSDPVPVVINEIHYNPGPDGEIDGDAEFVELYNPGEEAVDLSGMSFTGFTLTFEDGVILGAGEYAIVSPSISIAQSEWGVTPIAEFAGGGISGGGETIQLIAADGVTVVDEVTYDDSSPWPGDPDGNGPSLELINPAFDNNDAASWATSNGLPTPGAVNSVFGAEPVVGITDIVVSNVLPNQSFTISATIPDASFADLIYKIGFGEEVTVSATNIDGDIWQATLPGQDAGSLVRYRIESDVAIAPFNDTVNYLGVVVSPTDITGNTLPVLHWFVDPDEFENLVTVDFLTNNEIEAVVAYGDQVIDNATVRVRGSASRSFNKKGFKFELPDGYLLDFGDFANTPVDEFGIVADWADWTVASAKLSWEIFNAETNSQTSTFFTRVEQNADFYGVYRFQELYDGTWRTANGFDDGEFYQAEEGGWNGSGIGFDQKEPSEEDFTNILEVRDILSFEPSASKTAWIYDNVDVPEMINYMALSTLTRHADQFYHNFYVARDGSTGRWSQVEWDLDLTWRTLYTGIPGVGDPLTTPDVIGSALMDSVWEVPEFQQMYWTRLQTLVDTYLSDDSLVDRRRELIGEIGATNSALDFAAWGHSDIFNSSYFDREFQSDIDERQAAFAAETRLPGATISAPPIVINELHYNPAGDDAEFLELFNPTSQAVDLSGWTIDGVALTINFGTVILPGQYMVFTDADTQFREQSTGNIIVGGEYSGGLSGGGETITLSNADGIVIDEVSYDDSAPWATEPDGDGFTLALADPNSDNSLASSWFASNEINGTPGAANNTVTADTTQISIFAAGVSANEIVELKVDGVRVASFNLGANGGAAGDYSSRDYTELRWESAVPILPSDVRVYFVNDTYDPDNGIDHNVRIDKIVIDSVDYESESPTTFASGSWVSGQGISSGLLQTDRLHTNGFFQYDV
jgi:hypothetical protein